MGMWQDSLKRAGDETGYRGPNVVRTIGGVGEALRVDRRAEFYQDVLRVSTGDEFDGVLNLWWPQAVIDVAEDPQAAEDFADLALAHYSMACGARPTRYTHEEVMRMVGEETGTLG
ncbi:hypothetical protein NX801_02660 [Streptomyces sp. LP05-1]|uniref:DUF982 domain-containing protein n=1 Tax=Streptomyces pyxinae TaxID=2970734 RepID=A0ABT2CB39_9ACTN|nr:hypothetical protein [Streptomyces sp. LP05-1]MCS0634581.1 hypothetical protein [Streptomyces sp. LP05-1]